MNPSSAVGSVKFVICPFDQSFKTGREKKILLKNYFQPSCFTFKEHKILFQSAQVINRGTRGILIFYLVNIKSALKNPLWSKPF